MCQRGAFLLYINNLPKYISLESVTRLFADGCMLYRRINSDGDAHKLQKDLDGLQKWERDWLMEFPAEVSDHAYHQQKEAHYSTIYHTWTCNRVSRHSKSLNRNHHISVVIKKANNTSSFLQRNISQCPKKTKELCYITLDGICHCYLGSVHRSKYTEI